MKSAARGILALGLGYFVWYTPYAALVKALSTGILPGVDGPVEGFVLLPAAALGTFLSALIFLTAGGWWRHVRRRRVLSREIPLPGRETIIAGFFTAIIIGTTTLNYTFAGVSILLMLLLMRAGVLILSPAADAMRRRTIHNHSWAALGFSLLAVTTALSDVDSYHLTAGAALSLAAYLSGYIGRFQIMGQHAKQGVEAVDCRYFAEEHISAVTLQLAICAIAALIGQGGAMLALREGFTTFLTTPAALPALGIGVLYEGLFIFGTLIYLDRREYTWCVPANRCASLLAGVAASYLLTWLAGVAPPSPAQHIAAGLMVLALLALSYPALRAWRERVPEVAGETTRRALLFVCGGNTCRSPMAAAIAQEEMRRRAGARWDVASAGVSVRTPGAPMTEKAVSVLRELGIPALAHRARPLTRELCAESDLLYCMTRAQRDMVLALAPAVAARTLCLDPAGGIPDPIGESIHVYRRCALRIQELVRQRLDELPAVS